MAHVFVISDTHFGHTNICKFLRVDGVTKLRPWDDPNEMDAVMVDNWNKVVKPEDKVYHLGDVAINRRHICTMARLNGTKVLIKGNHDIFKLDDYVPYFKDIRAYHVLDKMIMSHVPIHTENLGRFKGNVHGHMHDRVIPDVRWQSVSIPDVRYKSVCVEQIGYTPIELSEVQKHFAKNAL